MMKEKVERLIVRIFGKDLDGGKPIYQALRGIKGVGQNFAFVVAKAFEKKTGNKFDMPLGNIREDEDKILEDIIQNPKKYGIPEWYLNRRKDFETGKDKHAVMSDLDLALRKNKQRLAKIKSYRGLRLARGLRVRGQKTRSSGRKGVTVGVEKKK